LACTLAQSVPLRIYISQVIGYWETETLWLKTDGHAKREKRKSTCPLKNKHTRKTRKTGICVSGRKQAYTQNKKNRNLRVRTKATHTRKKGKTGIHVSGRKQPIHAKQEKSKFTCRLKNKHTRKKGKAEICVSDRKKADTQNKKSRNLRVKGVK